MHNLQCSFSLLRQTLEPMLREEYHEKSNLECLVPAWKDLEKCLGQQKVYMTENNTVWLTIKILVFFVATTIPSLSGLKQCLRINFQA